MTVLPFVTDERRVILCACGQLTDWPVRSLLPSARHEVKQHQLAWNKHPRREWPQPGRWLDENREELRIRSYLVEDARRWVRLQREDDALYRGSLLLQARELAANGSFQLSPLEQEFIGAGIRHAEETERARRRLSTNVTRLESMVDHLNGEVTSAEDTMQSLWVDTQTTHNQIEQRLARIERQASTARATRFSRLMLAVLLGAVLSIAIWIALLMVK